jgi:polysaccharide biosynthesis transport protein
MINAARQEVPWELIASPNIKAVSSSSLLKDIFLGLGIGMLVGTGAAILLEKINDVIYSVKDLREELSISILGMVPNFREEQKMIKAQKSRNVRISDGSQYRFSPFNESFRALNSQIRLLCPDTPIKSLVISSSLPDEGKTTVALYLAQAAAAMGQRVLLVSADLRKQHSKNQFDNSDSPDGLTDVIAGTVHLMDAIQPLSQEQNLYILPAGSHVLDPTSLLGSKRMQDLMMVCRESFDLVIYDTAPLNFADSLLLIPNTDGLLMVARLNKLQREDLRNSLNTLDVANVPILGLVVNMVSGMIPNKNSANIAPTQRILSAAKIAK